MLDLRRFCEAHHIPYLEAGHHHSHQGWAQTHCPFCAGGRGGWHLGFNLSHGIFNCWRCGSHSVREVLSRLLKVPPDHILVSDAFRSFQTEGGRVLRTPATRRKEVKSPPNLGPLTRSHHRYLIRRGFKPSALEETWGLRGTTYASGAWSWRIVYPILNESACVVAYQGRAIGAGTLPKYRLTEAAEMADDPRRLLYGIHKAKGPSVLIVEGATGVWRLGAGTVATLGIDWKEEQADILRRYERRFILFDPEPRARERAEGLASWLSLFPGVTEILSGFATDPGDFSQVQADRVVKTIGLESS